MNNVELFIGLLIVFFFTIINFQVIRLYQNYSIDSLDTKMKTLGTKTMNEQRIFFLISSFILVLEIIFTLFSVVWPEFLLLIISGDINVANNQMTFEKVIMLSLVRLWGSFVLILNGTLLAFYVQTRQMMTTRKKDPSIKTDYNAILRSSWNQKEGEITEITVIVILILLVIKKMYYFIGLVFGILLAFLEISASSSDSVTILIFNPGYITTTVFGILVYLILVIFYRFFILNYYNKMKLNLKMNGEQLFQFLIEI